MDLKYYVKLATFLTILSALEGLSLSGFTIPLSSSYLNRIYLIKLSSVYPASNLATLEGADKGITLILLFSLNS